MAIFNKFNVVSQDLLKAKHDFDTHSYKFILSNTAPLATNTVKTNITEISSGNGYVAGGSAVGTSTSLSGEVASVVPDTDVVVSATGGDIGAFRYVVLYNDTTTGKPLVSFYDYGSSITLKNGETFTIDVQATLLELS